jgi:hypothetical protein
MKDLVKYVDFCPVFAAANLENWKVEHGIKSVKKLYR